MTGGRRVLVTGLGAVTAAGCGQESLWRALVRGQPLFSRIDRFRPRAGCDPELAGQALDFGVEQWVSPVLRRQTDRSTHLALAATRLALDDAGFELAGRSTDRVGVMVGHALGGMDYAEPQLRAQITEGPEGITPYQSIAWFYAAAMGQISIQLRLKGYSKAFVSDRCSGMHAVGAAVRAIQRERADVMLAGGTEAPLSPFLYRCLVAAAPLSRTGYSPFTGAADGHVLGEAACFLILEAEEHARARSARAYAEVVGYASGTDPRAGRGLSGREELARVLRLALDDANAASPVDYVFADGVGAPTGDLDEATALAGVLGSEVDTWRVSVAKSVVGDSYGAGAPLEIAAAARALREQVGLPLCTGAAAYVRHSRQAEYRALQRVLVNSRGSGGANACLVLAA